MDLYGTPRVSQYYLMDPESQSGLGQKGYSQPSLNPCHRDTSYRSKLHPWSWASPGMGRPRYFGQQCQGLIVKNFLLIFNLNLPLFMSSHHPLYQPGASYSVSPQIIISHFFPVCVCFPCTNSFRLPQCPPLTFPPQRSRSKTRKEKLKGRNKSWWL